MTGSGFRSTKLATARNFELHPLCTLFPRITGAEFEALKADILANGLRQPIVIHEGMILDGGNRYRACMDVGIEPETIAFSGGNLVSFVLSSNLHRRHLSPGQQAAIVASAQDWGKAQTVGNPQLRNVAQLETSAQRAAASGASPRTQQMADKVAKESPALAKRVAHGEVSLPEAVRQISPPRPVAVPVEEEPEDDGPSAEEIAFLEESTRADQAAYDGLIEVAQSDDQLASALTLVATQATEIARLKALVRTLEESRDGKMNAINEHIRTIKSLRRKIEKLEKASA